MARLRDALVQGFSLEELRFLCADLGIEYDDLSGDNRRSKAQELVEFCQTRPDPPQIEQLMVRRLPDGRGAALRAALSGGERFLRLWQQVPDHQEPERFWNPAGVPSYTSPDNNAV